MSPEVFTAGSRRSTAPSWPPRSPAIGYAGTYAFGNVFLMVAGPLVLLLA